MTAAAIAVAAGAVAQAVTGLGFSLVCAPFLIASLGRAEGVRLNLLLSAVLNVFLLAVERRHIRWATALFLVAPAAVATPAFAYLFNRTDASTLTVVAGAVTILSAAAMGIGARWHRARGRAGAALAGVISSGMNTLAGIGGPPIAIYAVNADWPAETIRPTLQAYFLMLNAVAIFVVGPPHFSALPWIGLAAGWLLGIAVARRVPDTAVRPVILLLAAAGGVVAILRAGSS